MTTKLAVREDEVAEKKPTLSLPTVERRLYKNYGLAFQHRIEMLVDFSTIAKEKLYEQQGFGTFREFLEKTYGELGEEFDYGNIRKGIREADLYLAIATKIKSLPEGSEVQGPSSLSQLRELATFKNNEEAADVYINAAKQAFKSGARVTGAFLRDWRGLGSRNLVPPTDVADSEIDFSDVKPAPKQLSGSAIAALDRLQAFEEKGVLPANFRVGIESGQIIISDSDLVLWGKKEDKAFVQIGRLLYVNGKTVHQAIRLINLSESTSLGNFAIVASSTPSGVGEVQFEVSGGTKGKILYRVSATPIEA